MAEWGQVRVATITEEDVEEEVVGEDGTVATITNPTPAAKENGIDSETSSDSESKRGSVIERQDSLVEKDDDTLPSSLLQSISFDTDPIHILHPRDTQTLPSRLSTSRSSSGRSSPSRASPSRTSPTPPSPSSPTLAKRKFTQRRGNRGPGFTMTLSDKFVTELTLHDPGTFNAGQGGTNAGQICLGLFLATDMITGDHSVYKVSPVSPLAVFKLKPQDRLMRLNGLKMAGWSHSCVLEWVRNLSLVEAAQQSDSPRELTLCLEYRRAGKSVRAAWETPSSRQVLATIAIAKKRASVRSVKETDTGVHYRHTTTCRMRLGLPSASSRPQHPQAPPRFLASRVLPEGGGIGLGVVEGKEADDQRAQFHLHTFEVSASLHEGRGSGREMMVVEAASPSSWFLLPCSLTHLTFMHCPWSAMQAMSQADPRCFTLHPTPDKRGVRVKGLYTGNFLSAGEGGVVLVGREDTDAHLPDSTIFQILPTEH